MGQIILKIKPVSFHTVQKTYYFAQTKKEEEELRIPYPELMPELINHHNLYHANYANAAADLLVLSFRLEFSVSNENCFNPRFPRLFHDFLSGASGVK